MKDEPIMPDAGILKRLFFNFTPNPFQV